MGETAARKWQAARTLYEKWGAPLELLRQAMGQKAKHVAARAKREKWEIEESGTKLRNRLQEIIEKQLTHLMRNENPADEEKLVRAVSMAIKTLTSLTSSHPDPNGKQRDSNLSRNNKFDGSFSDDPTNRTEELDKQLTALIKGLPEEE